MSYVDNYAALVTKARALDVVVASDLNLSEDQAHRIIRSILHAIRQQLPMNESIQLMAQLPLIWKGIYVEGWQPNKISERIHQVHEWLDVIRKYDQPMAAFDFGNDLKAQRIFTSVWKALSENISTPEITQICNCFPHEIKKIMTDTEMLTTK